MTRFPITVSFQNVPDANRFCSLEMSMQNNEGPTSCRSAFPRLGVSTFSCAAATGISG